MFLRESSSLVPNDKFNKLAVNDGKEIGAGRRDLFPWVPKATPVFVS